MEILRSFLRRRFAGKLLVARNVDSLNLFLTVTCNSSFLESKQGECFVEFRVVQEIARTEIQSYLVFPSR